MNFDVYCIDDRSTKQKAYRELATKLGAEQSLSFKDVPPQGDGAEVHDFIRSSHTIERVFQIATREKPSIILLDLNLWPDGEVFRANKRIDDLIRIDVEHKPTDQRLLGVLQDLNDVKASGEEEELEFAARYYTSFFVCAAAAKFGHRVILISTLVGPEVYSVLKRKYSVPSAGGEGLLQWVNGWAAEITKIFGDPVDRTINQYLVALDTDATVWTHAGCEREGAKAIARTIYGLDDILDNENKALHQIQEPGKPFTAMDKKPVRGITLRRVLAALEFPCVVSVEGGENAEYYLPVKPGLAFLLAVRELASAMTDGRSRDVSNCALRFSVRSTIHGALFGLSVTFDPPSDFDLIYRYVEKCSQVNSDKDPNFESTSDGAVQNDDVMNYSESHSSRKLTGLSGAVSGVRFARVGTYSGAARNGFRELGLAGKVCDKLEAGAAYCVAHMSLGNNRIDYYWTE